MSSNTYAKVLGDPTEFRLLRQPDGTYTAQITLPTDQGEVSVVSGRAHVGWRVEDGRFLITGVDFCDKEVGENILPN